MTTASDEQRRDVYRRLAVATVFAIAMAWVESAVVFYLRRLVGRMDPYQENPLPFAGDIGWTEVVREAATMVMLLSVGWLAGRSWRARFGCFAMAFGWWDIFYYVFLRIMTGWPRSALDWDILFLIPLPWWGPVLAPTLIALLMVVGGALLMFNDLPSSSTPLWPSKRAQAVSGLGVLLALNVFMADAIRAVRQGESLQDLLPKTFHWTLFLLAWALMAVAVVDLGRQWFAQRRR